jgi:hypothetical protein
MCKVEAEERLKTPGRVWKKLDYEVSQQLWVRNPNDLGGSEQCREAPALHEGGVVQDDGVGNRKRGSIDINGGKSLRPILKSIIKMIEAEEILQGVKRRL